MSLQWPTRVGFETFHLVGHDWGAAVGWRAVFSGSPRIESWTPLSIPHMGAYGEAIANDADQQQRSSYLRFLRLPWLPEMLFSFNDFAMLRENIYAEHGSPALDEYLAIFSEPGALTAALNWYRASELQAASGDLEVAIPTTFVWGNRDPVVGDLSLELQRRYSTATCSRWNLRPATGSCRHTQARSAHLCWHTSNARHQPRPTCRRTGLGIHHDPECVDVVRNGLGNWPLSGQEAHAPDTLSAQARRIAYHSLSSSQRTSVMIK